MESLNGFPDEILLKIFTFLPIVSQLDASVVCKRWHNIIESSIATKIQFAIRCPTHCDTDELKWIQTDIVLNGIDLLTKTKRKYAKLMLDCVNVCYNERNYLKQWSMFDGKLSHLCLNECVITDYQILTIVSNCPNLKQLSLTNNLYTTQNKRIFSEQLKSKFGESTKSLECLDISGGKSFGLCDALFMVMASYFTRLRSLNVSMCKIVFHSAFIRRYYFRANEHLTRATEYAFTFVIIMHYLKTFGSNIEHIDLSGTGVCKENLMELLSCEQLKQLRKLTINNCAKLNQNAIDLFKRLRPNIEIVH